MKVCQHDPNIYILNQNILKSLVSTMIFVVLKIQNTLVILLIAAEIVSIAKFCFPAFH